MSFSQRLKKAREARGMTLLELANKIERTEATVQRYESGNIKNLKNDTIEALAKALNVSPVYLMGWDDTPNITTVKELVEVPILGKIACGDPITAIENVLDFRTVPKDYLPKGELFFLEAIGKSMEPKIPDGSFVLCRRQEDVEHGEIAAVLVNNDEETTLKKVIKQQGMIILQPLNEDFAPYIVTEDNPARIVGKALKIEIEL